MDHENESKPDDSDSLEVESVESGRTSLKDVKELVSHLEMMHDRRIVRNLQSAGLSNFGFDEDDEDSYRTLDPHARMQSGEPLLIASILYIKDVEQQLRYTAILLCEGANPNETDDKGKTALMYACIYGYEKSAKALLQCDSINYLQRDFSGTTALMYASACGRTNILKIYIKTLKKLEKQNKSTGGAKIVKDNNDISLEIAFEMANNRGLNATMLALENNHYDCVEIIEEFRSKHSKTFNKKITNTQNVSMSTNNALKMFDSSMKYRTKGGSCESLNSNNAPGQHLDANPNTRRLLQTRQSVQFQSHQDLWSKGYTEQNPHVNQNINQNIDVSSEVDGHGKVAINIGIKVTNNERANFIQSKHELMRDLAMTKSYTESELSASCFQQGSVPCQKKHFAQGFMNLFKRRPKYLSSAERTLNHSISEVDPPSDFSERDDSDFRPKSRSAENQNKKSRRKSVDIGLRTFHHSFVENSSVGACPPLIPNKKPSDNNSPPSSASGWSLTNQASFTYPFPMDSNPSSTTSSHTDLRGTVLPPIRNLILSPEKKLQQREAIRINQQLLNQMWPIKDEHQMFPIKSAPSEKNIKTRSQSAENFLLTK